MKIQCNTVQYETILLSVGVQKSVFWLIGHIKTYITHITIKKLTKKKKKKRAPSLVVSKVLKAVEFKIFVINS